MSGVEIAAALAMASAVVSAAGSIQQGKASRRMADYQAAVAENNAIAARQEAERAERELREKSRRQLSANRARFAKGGVLPEEGSPLLFNIETGEGGEIDALNLRREGEMRATGFQSEAALGRYSGRVAQQQSRIKATSSLLDGMSAASKAIP